MLLELMVGGAISVAFVGFGAIYRKRWNRLCANYRQLERYADTLLQHSQGMILSIHGIVHDLGANDPVRIRIEQTLARADRGLSELRETMPRWSEQEDNSTQ